MPAQPAPIRPDDPSRGLTVARPDEDQALPHIGLAGDTYTILVTGEDTAGRYTLIDMHVPPGGGPPPHRHDFEEMFTVLDGEVGVTFRGETRGPGRPDDQRAGQRAASFSNASDAPARLLCLCAPAGQEDFFTRSASRWPPGPRRRRRWTPRRRPPSSRSPRRSPRIEDGAAATAQRWLAGS